jgi:hypothetical protein
MRLSQRIIAMNDIRLVGFFQRNYCCVGDSNLSGLGLALEHKPPSEHLVLNWLWSYYYSSFFFVPSYWLNLDPSCATFFYWSCINAMFFSWKFCCEVLVHVYRVLSNGKGKGIESLVHCTPFDTLVGWRIWVNYHRRKPGSKHIGPLVKVVVLLIYLVIG